MARTKTWLRVAALRLGLVLASLGLSLVLAEQAAKWLRRDAFPYLNLFVEDPTYGVALSPNASARIRSRNGRITEIQTNAHGFRGEDWQRASSASPVPGRVLLLGDSQVLGYGVPYPQTMAPRLAALLEGEVLNAAVPTWGPTEYARAVENLVPLYRPETLVFVANIANDWFEASVPNTRRTMARNGWAMRLRRQEQDVFDFPGRAWMMNRSHLYFSIRELHATFASRPQPIAHAPNLLLRDLPRLRKKPGVLSKVGARLQECQALCRHLGCKLMALALPLDVQVDAKEWSKYRSTPKDLRATEALLEDFIDDARMLDIPALNLLPVLRQDSPGTFLDDDYHLSPKGHAAIAHALAAQIQTPKRTLAGAQP